MRVQQYPLRYDQPERDAWQQAANQAGLPLAAWIRQTCNEAAGLTPGGHAAKPASDAVQPDAVRHRPHGRSEVRRWDDPVEVAEPMPPCSHPHKRIGKSGLAICTTCGKPNP